MKWYVWREEHRKKNYDFQMGIEPSAFRTLVGCSNHWATENSVVSRSVVGCRGGSRGRVQGVRTPPLPPRPEMMCGFLMQLVFCKKKNYVVYWCWSSARDECTPSYKKSWIRPWADITTASRSLIMSSSEELSGTEKRCHHRTTRINSFLKIEMVKEQDATSKPTFKS